MADGDAKTKGIGFTNVRGFTHARFGEEGWEALIAALSLSDREELQSIIPIGWYSLPLYVRLIRKLDTLHGASDLALLQQLGRYEAEQDLSTVQRTFLRLMNPAFIVEKTGEYWKRFHDTGSWRVERDATEGGRGGVNACLDGWGVVDAALCLELTAYVGRLLELSGAKNVSIEHSRCRARGDAQCVFHGRWGLPG